MNKITRISGLDRSVADFGVWALSDLSSNLKRAMFAEYIVYCSLGVDETVHQEWLDYDLKYKNVPIEVKCSAFWTPPFGPKPNKPSYDIAKRRYSFDWETHTYIPYEEPKRIADIYVFCLHNELDKSQYRVTDLSQWEFAIVTRELLDNKFGDQKTVGLNSLKRVATFLSYLALRQTVDAAIADRGVAS